MIQESITQEIIQRFENLELNTIDRLLALYDAQAFFKDPFNEVIGKPAIERIFTHMFDQVDQPRFIVTKYMAMDTQISLTWEFCFNFKNAPKEQQVIKGCTWLTLNQGLLITEHRDYWDAAEELYEKIPVLGGLMRFLKKRLRA
ncbi:MAG: hypothetical protein RLZZ410_622 [Pseudomonadota bacterium]|jgi:hypothetical protein